MKTLLCGIAKCENNYLREWVEWYKHIGVDKIVLYDNNDPDGEHFEDVIGDYIKSRFVQVIDYRGRTMCQKDAYNDCYRRYGNRYDWFLFFDVDEFLKIDRIPFDRKIKPWLGQWLFENFDAVKVCWKVMSDSGHIRVVDGNYSRDRFTEVAPKNAYDNMYCKTIVRGGLNIKYEDSVHWPNGLGKSCCNVLGEYEKPHNKMAKRKPLWTKAVLLHYRYRTIEEYIMAKRARMYADHDAEYALMYMSLDRFFECNKRTPEKEMLAKKLMK